MCHPPRVPFSSIPGQVSYVSYVTLGPLYYPVFDSCLLAFLLGASPLLDLFLQVLFPCVLFFTQMSKWTQEDDLGSLTVDAHLPFTGKLWYTDAAMEFLSPCMVINIPASVLAAFPMGNSFCWGYL